MKTFMKSKPKKQMEYPAFTNFTIKVDVKHSWHDTVKMVLKSVQGVTTFKMGDDGSVNISGYIDPNQLLKCLKSAGKKAQMVHWQYGECSNNLFENTGPPANDNGNDNGNGAGDYYLHPGYNGYGYVDMYGYNYNYPGYARNYPYRHLECGGNAEDCGGHHAKQPKNSDKSSTEKPRNLDKLSTEKPKNSDKSSLSIPKRIDGSVKDLIPGENAPKCCTLM